MGNYLFYGISNYDETIHSNDYELRYSPQPNYTLISSGDTAIEITYSLDAYNGFAIFFNGSLEINKILFDGKPILTDSTHGLVMGNVVFDSLLNPTNILKSSDNLIVSSSMPSSLSNYSVLIVHPQSAINITIDMDDSENTSLENIIVGNIDPNIIHGSDGIDNIRSYGGNDKITAGSGDDYIDGGAGADTMTGGLGDDTYYVDDLKDKVTEKTGEGIDTIQTTLATFSLAKVKEVENLTYTGTSNATLTGSKSANNITGSTGNDTFDGGLGNDTLTGGAGQDTFKFTTKLSTINIDTIADFTSGDKIGLSSKIFAKLKAGVTDANICIDIAPTESNDYIIYNTSTNTLSYDADGSGAKSVAVIFAVLTGVDTLSASDFQIV